MPVFARIRAAWRRIDDHLLSHTPELWLMRLHWLVLLSALACVGLAAMGLLAPAPSFIAYPDLSIWQEISALLAVLIAAAWSWRYLARTSAVHPALQASATRLFAGHLVCLLLIVLPTRVLPATLLWRFDALPLGTLDQDMREYADLCVCRSLAPANKTPQETYAVLSCEVLVGSYHRETPEACVRDRLRWDYQRILDIHRAHGVPADEPTYAGISDYSAKIDATHFGWLNDDGAPASLRALKTLWNAWCHRTRGPRGVCDSFARPDIDLPLVLPALTGKVIVPPHRHRTHLLLLALTVCSLALGLTCARLGLGRPLVRVAVVLLLADMLLDMTLDRFNLLPRHFQYAQLLAWCALGGFAGALLLAAPVGLGVRAGRVSVRTFTILSVLGCTLAPIAPVVWMISPHIPAQPGIVGMVRVLADRIDYNAYGELQAELLANVWLYTAAVALCSLLAARILVEQARRFRVTPSA